MNKEMKNKPKSQKNGMAVVIAVTVILLLAAAGVFFSSHKKEKEAPPKKEDVVEQEEEKQTDDYITYEGQKYKYNHKLRNILFMGIDKTEEFTDQSVGKGGQSDSLILLSMNREEKTTTLLEISRDAMTDIKTYDMNGKYLGTQHAQITLQYSFGDGKKRSCMLTKEAVSNLLYEIPIHSHIAMTIEGIKIVTDELGGVELTVPEDYTWINPQFEKGAVVNLKGDLAEQYVRSRDSDVIGSNKERMDRQSQFLGAFAGKIQEKSAQSSKWFLPLVPKLDPYMITDVPVDRLEELSKYTMKEKIEVVPGEIRHGERHDEFIVDNEELQKIIIKMFYIPV